MMPSFFKRQAGRSLVVEFSPYQTLCARASRTEGGEVVLDALAEFDRDDTAGFRRWEEANFDRGKTWMPTLCSLVPRRGILQRESVLPRRLATYRYLAELVEKQQEHRFQSATPFRVADSQAWTLRAVSAIDGAQISANGSPQPALICGIATDEVQRVQQRLLDHRLMPDRLEPGLLSLFGVLREVMDQRAEMRAVVAIVIHQTATAVYILGKEGVHTPSPVLFGLTSILEVAQKELGTQDEAETRARLMAPNREVLALGNKLVRAIGRNLKPVVDSYEMTTGQPVDEIFCAYLPAELAWLAEPLVRAAGRTAMAVDSRQWLAATGLHVEPVGSGLGPHWLGALGMAATLIPQPGMKTDQIGGDDPNNHRPWHVDCRLMAELATHRLAGRRMLTGAIAAALALFVTTVALWQLYARESLDRDTDYWEQQIANNRRLFDELTATSVELKRQTTRLARAHELIGMPFQLTDLVIDLGRTIPSHMRLERIETSGDRVIVAGVLYQPAEVASDTLGAYVDELRRDAAIGPRFSSIAITSLQRRSTGDAVTFEITLRMNPATS